MPLTEQEVLNKRSKAESIIMPFFDLHAGNLHRIIKRILSRFQDGEINRDEAYFEIRDQVSEEITDKDTEMDALINKYIEEMYIIGKEIAEDPPKLNAFDILFVTILYRFMKKYIYKAQKEIAGKGVLEIRDYTFETGLKIPTLEYIRNRFNAIIITEGSRHLTQGTIQVAINNGLMLIFHTLEDELVCPECRPYNGLSFFSHDVIGLLPLHTHCRCYFEIYRIEE